jgi:hypothetical protein
MAVDENGKPTAMFSKRFYYLKWPILMGLSLILGPIVLTIAD